VSSPKVSIIIPTKNAGKKLETVLKAIFSCKVNFELEIIAVDSGSCDETKSILSKYSATLINILPHSFSHGGSRNIGAARACGDILIFITQDAVPSDDSWLSNLLSGFDIPGVVGVYGRQLPNEDSSPIEEFFSKYLYPDKRIIKDSVDVNSCLLSDIFFSNVNAAALKSEWEHIKFNEDLIMSEDQDWAKRMLMQGKKILYEPSAAVFHSHRYSLWQLIQRNFDSGMSLNGIVKAPLRRSMGYELNYLKSGFQFFMEQKKYLYFLIFPFYEAVRLCGFALGFFSRYLPMRLKKFMSQNKAYWSGEKNLR